MERAERDERRDQGAIQSLPSEPPDLGERAAKARQAKVMAMVLALAVLLGADLAQPPRRQVSANALLGAIHLYQATLSPRMPLLGVQCRFTPTCSHYAEGAIRKYGAALGTARAVARIARCGPWTPLGTYDPP